MRTHSTKQHLEVGKAVDTETLERVDVLAAHRLHTVLLKHLRRVTALAPDPLEELLLLPPVLAIEPVGLLADLRQPVRTRERVVLGPVPVPRNPVICPQFVRSLPTFKPRSEHTAEAPL